MHRFSRENKNIRKVFAVFKWFLCWQLRFKERVEHYIKMHENELHLQHMLNINKFIKLHKVATGKLDIHLYQVTVYQPN